MNKLILIFLTCFPVLSWANPPSLAFREQDLTIFTAVNTSADTRSSALQNLLNSPLGLSSLPDVEIANQMVATLEKQGILPLWIVNYYELIMDMEVILNSNPLSSNFLIYFVTDDRLYDQSYQWNLIRDFNRAYLDSEVTRYTRRQWDLLFTIFWQNVFSDGGPMRLTQIINELVSINYRMTDDNPGFESLMEELLARASRDSVFAARMKNDLVSILTDTVSYPPVFKEYIAKIIARNAVEGSQDRTSFLAQVAGEAIARLPRNDLLTYDLAMALDNNNAWLDELFPSTPKNCFSWAVEVVR